LEVVAETPHFLPDAEIHQLFGARHSTRYDPPSMFAEMVAATKKPGD
jgi:hypothetical protein